MLTSIPLPALLDRLRAFDARPPNTQEYQELSHTVTEHPLASALADLDPFSARYRDAAMRLYLDIRGADAPYDAYRDERSGMTMPTDLAAGVLPWTFRDPAFVAEFLYSWAQIFRLLDVKPGQSVLEYGPGSGQILLMLAKTGVTTFGVDIDAPSIELIRLQAQAANLDIRLEQNTFGEGFDAETFDRILFFEAFHHAFDFLPLLRRLRDRVRPGGHLVLCGEPVLGDRAPNVPFPWGPRLDALSILCMRNYGWMELGFTEPFLLEAFRRAGWEPEAHPFPPCDRASAYVARRADAPADPLLAALEAERRARRQAEAERDAARAEAARHAASPDLAAQLAALHASTSWRLTAPLRAAIDAIRRTKRQP